MEEWKEVPGYEGLYEVSNTGNVRSLIKNKIIKGFINRCGYRLVGLTKNGIFKRFQVHRLVAQAFIPNPDNLPQINHKDENPSNNMVDNLEWCDATYNINYGARTDRVKKTQIENGYWLGWDRKEYRSIYKQYIGVKRRRECDIEKLKIYEEYRNRKRKNFSGIR